tara:strand:- start:527 stop:820 length:294 start_codon:yes stop_codon:yes gene_type:complete
MEIGNFGMLIVIAISTLFGTVTGAIWMFYKMVNDTIKLKKELDFKSNLLQRIKSKYSEGAFTELDMINFAKFNTKHYDGLKNVYDKLDLYKRTSEKQ